jgi:pyruvate kinase
MGIQCDIKLLIYRRTKIVATLGPSSSDADTIERLITAGVNAFRLNMSHGTHEGHREAYLRVRAAAEKVEKPVTVIADLGGPKIRVGTFHGGRILLTEGDTLHSTVRWPTTLN